MRRAQRFGRTIGSRLALPLLTPTRFEIAPEQRVSFSAVVTLNRLVIQCSIQCFRRFDEIAESFVYRSQPDITLEIFRFEFTNVFPRRPAASQRIDIKLRCSDRAPAA